MSENMGKGQFSACHDGIWEEMFFGKLARSTALPWGLLPKTSVTISPVQGPPIPSK